MFIVVAIVIFGIFVSLSYTLFGKTLQPTVVSLFSNATEQTSVDLNKVPITKIDSGIKLDSMQVDGSNWYSIPYENFKQGGKYKLSFDITLDEGALNYLGGHFHLSNNSIVKVDGVKVLNTYNPLYGDATWRYGFKFPSKVNIGQTKHIDIEFTADTYNNPGHPVKEFRLQPNRIMGAGRDDTYYDHYKVTLNNIKLATYN